MQVPIIKIGNSRGIRLPKNILQKLNFEDKVELNIQNDELVVKSFVKKAREGWNEAFAQMSKNKEDKLFIPDNNDDDDTFEWVW